MKAINAIIILLVLAVVFASYHLITKIFPKTAGMIPAAISAITEKSDPTPDPEPARKSAPDIVQQPNPQPASPLNPQTETPNANQTVPPPAPPVKQEPKLRPVRDIKVVMYVTDW